MRTCPFFSLDGGRIAQLNEDEYYINVIMNTKQLQTTIARGQKGRSRNNEHTQGHNFLHICFKKLRQLTSPGEF